MTYVSTPNSGALPRRRVFQPGSFGAVALVVAIGAGIAGGIAVSNDGAQTAQTIVSPLLTENQQCPLDISRTICQLKWLNVRA